MEDPVMEVNRIDARGLACPQPVVLTKQALAEGGFDRLEIVVDNEAAVSNVSRFASHAGYAVQEPHWPKEGFLVSVAPAPAGPTTPAVEEAFRQALSACPAGELPGTAISSAIETLFIGKDTIGNGERELGHLLMGAFLYTLTEQEQRPRMMIFMNSGVKLAVEGAKELGDLQKLEAEGMEMLVCGTCLDYYQLKERLRVGRISNMWDIAENLMQGKVFSI
jgi:selenium metabolism protein YedF